MNVNVVLILRDAMISQSCYLRVTEGPAAAAAASSSPSAVGGGASECGGGASGAGEAGKMGEGGRGCSFLALTVANELSTSSGPTTATSETTHELREGGHRERGRGRGRDPPGACQFGDSPLSPLQRPG